MNFMYETESFEPNTHIIKLDTCVQDATKHKKTKSHRKARETSEERKIRREKDRLRIAAARARETLEERNARLAIERERKRALRARENSESKQIRNAKNRMRQAINRANETFEETQARKVNDRIRHMELRSRETLEEREIRLAKDRARHRKYRCKTIKKEFIVENNNVTNSKIEIPNKQLDWLRLRESFVNLKHSSQSTIKIGKVKYQPPKIIQIKEEVIDPILGFNVEDIKTETCDI